MFDINNVAGFDWDEGNLLKNWERHQVAHVECEQVFFNLPLMMQPAAKQPEEERYLVLGQTNKKRRLFIVFTMREERVRVISARDMSRKERKLYAEITADFSE